MAFSDSLRLVHRPAPRRPGAVVLVESRSSQRRSPASNTRKFIAITFRLDARRWRKQRQLFRRCRDDYVGREYRMERVAAGKEVNLSAAHPVCNSWAFSKAADVEPISS